MKDVKTILISAEVKTPTQMYVLIEINKLPQTL